MGADTFGPQAKGLIYNVDTLLLCCWCNLMYPDISLRQIGKLTQQLYPCIVACPYRKHQFPYECMYMFNFVRQDKVYVGWLMAFSKQVIYETLNFLSPNKPITIYTYVYGQL